MRYYHRKIAIVLILCMIMTLIPQRTTLATENDNKTVDIKASNTSEISKKEEATIVKELEDQREEYSKKFLKSDGTFEAVVYNKPVHYKQADRWLDINNKIQEATDPELKIVDIKKEEKKVEKGNNKDNKINDLKKEDKNILTNVNNSFKVNLSKRASSDSLVKISKDKYVLSWNLENANNVKYEEVKKDNKTIDEEIAKIVEDKSTKNNKEKNKTKEEIEKDKSIIKGNEKKKTLENISTTVNYKDVFKNVDLQYSIDADIVKENFIIKDKMDVNEFKFNLSSKNITAIKNDKTIDFVDKNDKNNIVFSIQDPYMYDKKGDDSRDIKIDFKETEEGYTLVLTPNKEWINSKDRTYPIVIDPIVNTSQVRTDIFDTFARQNDSENKYNNQFLRVGNNIGSLTRSYIKFNLPTFDTANTITAANLNLVLYNAPATNQINVHKVTSSYGTSVSGGQVYGNILWNNMPSYNGKIEDCQIVSGSDKWVTFDVTGIVKDWYTTGNNNGLMLKSDNESVADTIFWSSDMHNAYKDYRPIIQFNYINNSGIEGNWTYHSQDVGRVGSGSINDYNGNLVYTVPLISESGSRMPIGISLVYNSKQKNNKDIGGNPIGFGNGWRLNLSQRIIPITSANETYYKYIDGDGTEHYFKFDSEKSKYVDYSGADLELELNYNNGYDVGYSIKDKKDNRFLFIKGGLLFKIIDNNNNVMELNYDGPYLKDIYDGTGRKTTLDVLPNGYVVGITDFNNRRTSIAYNGVQLTSVVYPDAKEGAFSYDGKDNLTVAKNIDGYKIAYDYYQGVDNKVRKSYEIFSDNTIGKSLDLVYGYNTTSFIDNRGRKETYLFNNSGNTTTIIDSNGRATYYNYGQIGNITKLQSSSKLQTTVTNYILNHNFEYGDNWWSYNDAGSNGSSGYISSEKYLGNKSIYVSKTNTTTRGYSEQSLILQKGKTYTFSGYIKSNNVSNVNGKGANLLIHFKDKNGNWLEKSSEYVSGTNDWQKKELTITIPKDAESGAVIVRTALTEESGTAYFDCLQLEDGITSNRYNLVENANFRSTGDITCTNYISNHNFENSNNWLYCNDDASVGNSNYTTDEKYLGNRSLYVTKTNTVDRSYQQQYMILQKGKTYTFSGYIKSKNISNLNGKGANLLIHYKDRNGNWLEKSSDYVNGTNDWQRKDVTITIPEDATSAEVLVRTSITGESGTAYFDCLQLVDGVTSYRYSSSDNPSFKEVGQVPSSIYWNTKNSDSTNAVIYSNDTNYPTSIDSDKTVYKMGGFADKNKNVYQDIPVSGKSGDVFIGAGWAKGEPIPSRNGTYFTVDIGVEGYDGVMDWSCVQFNQDSTEWQYAAYQFIAKKDYKSIRIHGLYNNNANTVYFDGFQLYKEEFGTSYQYDSKGNIISTADLANKNSTFEYSAKNDLLKATDPKGSSYNYTYDDKHNVKTATTAENVVYSFDYDSYGNPKTSKISGSDLAMSSSATYTKDGNYIRSLTDNDGNTVKYNYDGETPGSDTTDIISKGNLTSTTDTKNNTTLYEYDNITDVLKNISKTVDGKQITNSYTYENDKIKTINHNGFGYTFNYDKAGNTNDVSVGTQKLITNNNNILTGNLDSSTYGNGNTIVFQYDALDRVVGKKLNGDTANRFSYEYDANGNLGADNDTVNNVSRKYYYDLSNRLGKVIDSNNNSFKIGYDKNNNVSDFEENYNQFKNFKTSYVYDKDNKPKEVNYTTDGVAKKITSNYDSIGRLKSKVINTGSSSYTTAIEYKKAINGETTNKVESYTNGSNSIKYTYDKAGNIETITDAGKVTKHYYNELSELIREDNQDLNKTIVYSYDGGGNILNKIEYPYTTGTLGTAITTVNYGYGDSNWKDKLTSYDGKAITYDQIGNPLTYDGNTYSWEGGRQLSGISGNGKNTSYKYNDSGIRTQKTVNGVTTKYQLSGDKVLLETNPTDKIHYTYDSTGNLASMNLNSVEYYYIRNSQGDITGLLDAAGTQVVKYSYNSYGKLLSIDGTLKDTVGVKNPYRYRGYRYDTETGLYYLNSRYYNAEWGRFINADGLVSTIGELLSGNMFAYCENNPINREDPSGYRWSWIKQFVSAVGNAINAFKPALSVAGGISMANPFPGPEDIVAAAIAAVVVVAAVGYATYTTAKSISIPKVKEKTKEVYKPKADKVVYRYGGTNPGNFVPTKQDVATNTGLSFSTIPRPGAAMTTIGALNATGVVSAVQDSPTHVSVTPIGGTIKEWNDTGSSSIWTQAVKSVVVKWDGGK